MAATARRQAPPGPPPTVPGVTAPPRPALAARPAYAAHSAIAQHPADSQSAAGWIVPVRDAACPAGPASASRTGPGAAASMWPARLDTKAASSATAATAFAVAVGSENHTAETRPRPRLVPKRAAGARARSAAQCAMSRAIGSANSPAMSPSSSLSASPSGLASTNRTVTPLRESSPIRALT
jgi:hypothetical protein